MDFNQEEYKSPRITNLPDEQFQTPSNEQYFQDANYQPVPVEVEVKPFVPISESNQESVHKISNRLDDLKEQEIVNWQAQDMLIGDKDAAWYIWFAIAILLLLVASYFMNSWTFAVLVIVSAVAIVATRSNDRRINIISYSLSTRGVYVDNIFYPYSDFRAFGVLKEKDIYSIIFLPKKRFSAGVTIYFSKENGEKITDIVGARLPMEQMKHDFIDKIIRKINL